MGVVINDLVTKFSFEGSPAPVGEYNNALGDSIALIAGLTASIYAAATAFAFWTSGTLKGADALNALSRETGVTVGKLQELNFMAGQTQSSQAAVESTISSLSQTIGQAAQRGNDDFARLGISVRDFAGNVKSADTILLEVGNRFKQLGLTMQEQRAFASSLGIDTSLLRLMNKTSGEMALMSKRARQLGILTADQTEQAASYTMSLKEMWFGLNSIKQLVAVGVAPEMRRLSSAFTDLLVENKAWIIDGIKFAIEWVGNFMAFMNRMLPVFALVTAGFFAMKVATLGWAGALALLSRVPIVLGITAIVLAVDDLITAFRGGKSIIADFFKDTFDVDVVEGLSAAFKIFGQGLDIIFGQLQAIWNLYLKFIGNPFADFFKDTFDGGVVEGLTSAFNILGQGLSAAFGQLKAIWDLYTRFIGNPLAALFSSDTGGTPEPRDEQLPPPLAEEVPPKRLPPPLAEEVAPAAPGEPPVIGREIRLQFVIPTADGVVPSPRVDNRQIVQTNTINVSTNDPEAAARAIDNTLQAQLRDANTQLVVGGR